MIKFGYTILYVQDVNKSIEFYEKAFGFQRTFIAPDGDYGELTTGNTKLSFASVKLAKNNLKNGFIESDLNSKPFGIEIGFVTEAVGETTEIAVAAGAVLVEKPKTKPWGQVVSYVRDPDGFLIEICSPMN
ncbi:VOC family protein [Sporocytophaga myxococcoides]|uniref:VOC family protein n=1 Tax=Sporocytophaga myxococcoides TaxID=153721 RepID=UPI00040806B2|nr:VOC family protein [Sporocytophaga myxococcoides]